MTFTTDSHLDTLTRRFKSRTLPKPDWTHEAHFGVALSLLAEDALAAFRDMPDMIRAYNLATGVPNTDTEGYHETITRVSLRAAFTALEKAGPNPRLHEVLAEMMSNEFGRSDWLFRYWSKAHLFSADARRRWVKPDLEPLPFISAPTPHS